MGSKETKIWVEGCKAGSEIVLEFLKEVKNVDWEEEFKAWSNCDSYSNWKGEKIDKTYFDIATKRINDALHENDGVKTQ